jgi:hypothetical protein
MYSAVGRTKENSVCLEKENSKHTSALKRLSEEGIRNSKLSNISIELIPPPKSPSSFFQKMNITTAIDENIEVPLYNLDDN